MPSTQPTSAVGQSIDSAMTLHTQIENSKQVPKVDLFLRVENNNNTGEGASNGLEFVKEEIKLTNKNATIFQYIQNLISLNTPSHADANDPKEHHMNTNTLHFEKMKNVWNMNYTLIYRESVEEEEDVQSAQRVDRSALEAEESGACSVEQILQLLTTLKRLVNGAETAING